MLVVVVNPIARVLSGSFAGSCVLRAAAAKTIAPETPAVTSARWSSERRAGTPNRHKRTSVKRSLPHVRSTAFWISFSFFPFFAKLAIFLELAAFANVHGR